MAAHSPSADHPPVDRVRVRRALISVSDKTGVVEFARALASMGVSIISTGGTSKVLKDSGINVTNIEDVTGFPEMMDGRVKTLHPKVHGGILAVRSNPEHTRAMREHHIEPIDLVCINLYPFQQTVAKPNVSRAEAIENIDIGGPSMVRSAAKNHDFVCVVTDASQYESLLNELKSSDAHTTRATRARLAQAAFAMTGEYDRAIAQYLAGPGALDQTRETRATGNDSVFPAVLSPQLKLKSVLRQGENPHQAGAVYANPSESACASVLSAKQLHGKEMSYNNVADAAAALDLALALTRQSGFSKVGACVIKHANPCGAAIASSSFDAIDRAIAGDPIAAFGGILACSHTIDTKAAERLTGKETFLEVIIAPAFSDEAQAMLKAKSVNVRLLATGDLRTMPEAAMMMKSIAGGVLVQQRDLKPSDPSSWVHAAGPKASEPMLHAAAVLETIVRAISSNAIAIGGFDGSTVRLFGGGVGQVDRVTACKLAVSKAGALCTGAIALSDAFFPFNDGPKVLTDAGVKMIVHPGGSKRDSDTFELCEKLGVTCMTTGTRRFRH